MVVVAEYARREQSDEIPDVKMLLWKNLLQSDRFATVYERWREVIVAMLRRGQAAGQVRDDIDLAFAASAAIALIEGTITQSRLAPDEIVLDEMIDPLCALLSQALEEPA